MIKTGECIHIIILLNTLVSKEFATGNSTIKQLYISFFFFVVPDRLEVI